MRKRNILTTALALTAAAYAARFAAKSLIELARYQQMRDMSDEGSMAQDFTKVAGELLAGERAAAREWASFFVKSPLEMARYLRMESL